MRPLRIGVARRDGLIQADGDRDDIMRLIMLLHGTEALRTRWTVCGCECGVSICWPMEEGR